MLRAFLPVALLAAAALAPGALAHPPGVDSPPPPSPSLLLEWCGYALAPGACSVLAPVGEAADEAFWRVLHAVGGALGVLFGPDCIQGTLLPALVCPLPPQ